MNAPAEGALQHLLAAAEAAPTLRDAAHQLRSLLPHLQVAPMEAYDLRHEEPLLRGERRSLFLAARDGHCWHITTEPREAGAVFVTDTVRGLAA